MKKVIAILMVLFSILLFSSCVDPEHYRFDYEELESEVTSIELIDYSYDNPKIVKDLREILPYNFDLETVVESLAEEEKINFLKDFANKEYFVLRDSSNSAYGLSIKVSYQSGNFVIVSTHIRDKRAYSFCVVFNNSGEPIEAFRFADRTDFVELVNTYFNTKVD